MKKKLQSPQVGIRVKNIQSRRYTPQSTPQSAIFSQPFTLSFSSHFPTQQSHTISETLSQNLLSQIQKLNTEMKQVASIIKLKQKQIMDLEKKIKIQDIQHSKAKAEMKSVLEMRNGEIKRRDEEIARKNEEIERYRAELNIHVEDIRTQNKEMIVHLLKELQREREVKEVNEVMEQERALRSLEQNSVLQRQMEQNSFLQKQLEQTTMVCRHNSPTPSNQNILSPSPSFKRIKIQKPKMPSPTFKPLFEIVKQNAIKDLQQSIQMISPLTLNIEELEPREKAGAKQKYLRRSELQNKYFQF